MAVSPVLPKLVGERVKRREDPRLIQGRATYVDDIALVGMQYIAFKRSDVAHARIRSVDTRAAEAMDGVEAVFTGAQVAEFLAPMPIGTPFPSPEHRAVAVDTVRFSGEPVAVVVARDRFVARDAVDAIVVSYDPLPAVVDVELAMTGKPTVIYPALPNNSAVPLVPAGTGVSADGKVDDSAIDEAFARADLVISQRMVNQRLAPTAMEPRGVVAHYEPGKGTMTIWSSTQNPHILRTFIAALTGLGENQVRAIAPEVGGGFGAKINIYGEEYVAAAVSKRLGIPVKWTEDRSEAFVATTHGRDILGYVDLAAKRDGTVVGLKLRLIADIGAYNMLLTAAIPTLTTMMANATYNIPAIRATVTEVFTNKTPTDAYRGAGRPEATYFVERAMDMLARELKMDPAQLRRKNFIQPSQFPFATQTVGGAALRTAGSEVKAKRSTFATALLEAEEDDVVCENGTISVKGSPASGKPFASVAAYAYRPVPLPEGLEPGLSDEAFFEPSNNTYPFGCHISMVEIDRKTGEPTLLKLVAVDDAGNLINPLIVEGQIHGGLAQGIGQAMIEEVVYNEDGQLVTGSFMDYAIPRAIDFPRFELDATVTPTPVNPLGAKGVGEAGTLGATPSVVSATVDALSGFGVKHIDMMLRPEKLWRIIQGGQSCYRR